MSSFKYCVFHLTRYQPRSRPRTCVFRWVELADSHLGCLFHQRSWREDLSVSFLPGRPQLLQFLLPSQVLLDLLLYEVQRDLSSGLQASGLPVLPPGPRRDRGQVTKRSRFRGGGRGGVWRWRSHSVFEETSRVLDLRVPSREGRWPHVAEKWLRLFRVPMRTARWREDFSVSRLRQRSVPYPPVLVLLVKLLSIQTVWS